MKKINKYVKTALTFTGIGVAGAAVSLSAMFYRYTFCRHRGLLLPALLYTEGHDKHYYKFRDNTARALSKIPCSEHTINTKRGINLKGYYYAGGRKPSGKIAFLVHGYHSEHLETCGQYYDFYMSRGIDMFCPDNPGCGKSGGELISFGKYESEACLEWIDFLKERYGEDIQIILHGFSMGAATVMMMSDRCPLNVKFIVEDCGFSDGEAMLKPALGPIYGHMRRLNRLIAGYDISKDCKPKKHLLRSNLPVLFVHGQQDKLVPFHMGKELYEAYHGEKDQLFHPDARHVESMYRAAPEYKQKLDNFIQRYLK